MPIAPRRHPACGGRRQEREIKGIIFSLLEEVVVNEHGENAWDDTLERAALDGAYTAVGNYPDSEFLQLLPFLLTLNDIIHPEVRKLYPDADVPVFDFSHEGESTLVVGYRSARRLCFLAEGFIEGASSHFGQHVTIEQRLCMHDGNDRCDLVCTFQ